MCSVYFIQLLFCTCQFTVCTANLAVTFSLCICACMRVHVCVCVCICMRESSYVHMCVIIPMTLVHCLVQYIRYQNIRIMFSHDIQKVYIFLPSYNEAGKTLSGLLEHLNISLDKAQILILRKNLGDFVNFPILILQVYGGLEIIYFLQSPS